MSDDATGLHASPPPLNRMVIAILAMAGLFVALYLMAHNMALTGPIVCGIGDCGTVQSSVYAKVGPIPVSAIGVAGYLALLCLAYLGVQPVHRESPFISAVLFSGSLGGVTFSAYLTYLEAFVIEAWCQYCVISAIVMLLIFLATLPEVPRFIRRAS